MLLHATVHKWCCPRPCRRESIIPLWNICQFLLEWIASPCSMGEAQLVTQWPAGSAEGTLLYQRISVGLCFWHGRSVVRLASLALVSGKSCCCVHMQFLHLRTHGHFGHAPLCPQWAGLWQWLPWMVSVICLLGSLCAFSVVHGLTGIDVWCQNLHTSLPLPNIHPYTFTPHLFVHLLPKLVLPDWSDYSLLPV